MAQGNYFDLTTQDINKLTIKKDVFNATLEHLETGEVYCGFQFSDKRYIKLNFHKDKKGLQKPRFAFYKGKKIVKDGLGFQDGDVLKNFWKMIGFLLKHFKDNIDLGDIGVAKKDDISTIESFSQLDDVEFRDAFKKFSPQKQETFINAIKNKRNLVDIQEIENILEKWDSIKTENGVNGWQQFFKKYDWLLKQIFSIPLHYVKDLKSLGGKENNGEGERKNDFLYIDKQTYSAIIIEIKTMEKPLLLLDTKNIETIKYRNNYLPSNDLVGGVLQVLDYKNTYIEKGDKKHPNKQESMTKFNQGSQLTENERIALNDLSAINVRCVLIIGNLDDLKTQDKKNSFELYKQSVKEVEIITFDQLKGKIIDLKAILENFETKK